MKLKQAISAAAFLLLYSSGAGFAQESVDSAELQRAEGPVEFISNTAAPDRVDTREQIVELGGALGRAARGGAELPGVRSRYFVIHRLYPAELDKLDADIFGLGAASGVDTISNLRLIIQGYLEAAYGYSAADARLLAEYITIYNAVYRQNRAYFAQRYKSPLFNDLTPGNEGLALHFREWPGKTLMLVPLMTASDGSLSAVDTTSITDASVIDKMREDADKGIGSRQGMVDLKEREADAAERAAAQQKAANAEEERRIAAERQRLAEEAAKLDAEKAKLDAAKKTASPDEAAALDEQAKELARRADELTQEEKKLDDSGNELEKNKEAARETEAFAERKAEEAQRDRESIAADQREMITGAAQAKAAAAAEEGVLTVRLVSSNSPRGTLLKVNPASGATVRSSALSQVSARTITALGGKILVTAVSGGKTRLVEVDPASLQSLSQSEDELNGETMIWVSGVNIYALVVVSGKNYIARFNNNLQKLSQSSKAVHPWAALTFQGDKIVTQDAQGTVIILNANDLTE